MSARSKISLIISISFLLAGSEARAVGFGVTSGVDYQDRNFSAGSQEYDIRQILFFVQPQLNLSSSWKLFARLGYSNLVYDSPSQGGKDYDEWGWEAGGGVGWTPLRWSGLYLGAEAGFFLTRTEGSSRQGDYLNWGIDIRGGWDLGVVDAYLGAAYDDGQVKDSSSDPEDTYDKKYRLDDPWAAFAGAILNVPFLPTLHGRYYFSKDRLALLALSYEF